MEVFRAETGKRLRVSKRFESLGAFKAEIEQLSGVSISSQILITSAGIQLRDDIDIKNERIFLFNRELLDSKLAINIESLNEKLNLEPSIIASITTLATEKAQYSSTLNNLNISDECGTYANLFQKNHSQGQSFIKAAAIHTEICERLHQEQRVQLMALDVALSNLDSHCRSIVEVHEVFNAFSEKEINKQDMLIKSLPIDIEIIRNISVHPELLKSAGIGVDGQRSYSLADFISLDEFTTLAEKGRDTYGQFSRNVKELEDTVQRVKSGTEMLRKRKYNNNFSTMESTLVQIREGYARLRKHAETIERDLSRVQSKISEILKSNARSLSSQSISTFEALAEYHAKEYLPDMQRLDEWLREQVVFFVKCKNAMTSTMISSLQQISYFESTIAGIPGTLSSLESEIKLKSQEFKKLSNIRQIPLAYAMTLIEILRRSEYTKLFLSKAQQLAEAMANFRNLEQKRRDNYRLDVKSYVPLNISALDDSPPMCEVSTLNLRDDRLPSFSKADVKAFFDLIEKIRPVILSQASLFKSQIAASSLFKTQDQQTIQQTVIDILSSLQSKSARSYGQIERMDIEFDKIVEKSFHLERLDIDKNNQTLSRPVSIFEGMCRSLAPPSPQMGRRASRTSRQSFSEDSGSTVDSTTDRLLLETLKELDRSKETIKKYEARIKKLEDLLHTNYQSSKSSTMLTDTHKSDSKFSISAIEQELSDLRSRYNELESIYNSELNNKAELEMFHLQLKKSHNEKSNQLEELQNHVNELNKALLDERSEKKTLCDKYDSKFQELEALLHESNRKNADLKKELEALKADNELVKKEKDAVEADLEKKLEVLKADNELVKKEKDAVEAETITLDSKVNNILAENNKLKSQLEDGQKQNEERERLHKQELDQLQKQSDERSENDKQNMLQEIEGLKQEIEDWKLNLEKMNSAREDLEQDLARSREKVKSVEQDYNERTKALAAAEKLIKDISETINEYMYIVTSNEVSSNSEQMESGDNLDPIIMIRKVGDVAKYLDQKLRETSQSVDTSSTLNTNLEHSLSELRRVLEERTEFSKGLSKSLWEYYNNLRELTKTMKLSIPTLADNYAMSAISMPQDVDDKKTGLSDSCYTEDLSEFFLNNSSDEQSVWPKDKYETLLSLTMKVKLDEVQKLIVRTLKEAEILAKQSRRDSKLYREKYQKVSQESRDKIAFQNFKTEDVALFLPTRSSPLKTYAAFNYNCPYYFLRVTDASKNKDYIIGRIIKISDHIALPEYNPYELPVGVKYYIIDADENWQSAFNSSHSRRYTINTSDTATRIHKNRQSLPSRSLSSSGIISNDVRSQSVIDIKQISSSPSGNK